MTAFIAIATLVLLKADVLDQKLIELDQTSVIKMIRRYSFPFLYSINIHVKLLIHIKHMYKCVKTY